MESTRDRILEINIRDEMEKSYIDYAMSVIVSRALPDVRDGLKPVHRRILYAMNELGFTHEKQHRKSARIVGDVLGKYHPHGDQSVYNAMVRLAQDFSTRALLIDGHGNFGSIDGDSAAAMRYTEARMTRLSSELLKDIEKKTVDFSPNFDETTSEPSVLPSRYPNLLANGSNGIAVGMATSIPPHNLGEIIDATVLMIDNRETTVDELIEIVKGPDFPTGAEVMGIENIKQAYRTGKGKAVTRSKATIEEMSNGKSRIVVTEIPYLVNKSKMLENIADLVKSKKIDGITDLRDESNREGIRIVIELRRDVNANVILNKLYKNTQLQSTFSINMIALVDNQPRLLNLYEILDHYINHQRDVETRRIQFDLEKAEARAHIIEGLLIALDNIDEIISIIRSAYDNAKEQLMQRFDFSEIQAQAILDMRLRRLQGLEKEKLEEEFKELSALIKYFNGVLADDNKLMDIIKEDLLRIKDKYADERRTQISLSEEDIDIEDLIERKEVTITLTQRGYIKRVPQDVYQAQNRGGRGKTGLSKVDEDHVIDLFTTSSHDDLLFFTNFGRMYRLKAYRVPEASRISKGTAIVNLLQLNPEEKINAVIPVKEFADERKILMITKNGVIKRMDLTDIETTRKAGILVINLKENDELISVRTSDGQSDVLVSSKNGKSIRFSEEQVRTMGRSASGVNAIKLEGDNEVVSMDLVTDSCTILSVTENGYGKRTEVSQFRAQTRGGKGILSYKVNDKTGNVIGTKLTEDTDEILMINTEGIIIRLRVSEIPVISRNTSGVILMKNEEDSKVASIAKVTEIDDEEDVTEVIVTEEAATEEAVEE